MTFSRAFLPALASRIRNSAEKVLSFAAVGPHGREWCSRIACALLLAMASSLFPLVAAADAPQPAAGSDAALAINTLIVRREPMLDVADAGEWLVVLGPDSVAVYRRDDAIRRGAPVATVPVVHTRPWPRDLRGTLT